MADAYQTWKQATLDAIDAAAKANGWLHNRNRSSVASTGSEYLVYAREVRGDDQTDQDVEDYGLSEVEEITVRISDHGSAHCSEDYSLAFAPSGDDHTLTQVLARFARPAKG